MTRDEVLRNVNCFNDYAIEKIGELEEMALEFEVNFELDLIISSNKHRLRVTTDHRFNCEKDIFNLKS